ncbi:MAG: transposase [Candidatus Saccharimonas sp.]|nr:transposase [Planctomycetaceae bacterium]
MQGTNRRAVSTNRPGWHVHPTAVDDEYTKRGESENRNKEELAADRWSDHRFLANFFRLDLHAAALNLLVRLRRATARQITVNTTGLNRNAPRATRRMGSPHLVQPPMAIRPAGGRLRLHVMPTMDQSRRRDRGQRSPCPGPPKPELALRRRIPPPLPSRLGTPAQPVIIITHRAAKTPTSPFKNLWGDATFAPTQTSTTLHKSQSAANAKKGPLTDARIMRASNFVITGRSEKSH